MRARVAAALLPFLAACGPAVSPRPEAPLHSPWAVYLYIAGDAEDLSPRVPALLETLRAATPPEVALRVEVDDLGPGGHLRARVGGGVIEEASRLPEAPAVEPALAAFLAWARADAPGEHTAVIVWGHGLGARGGLALDATPPDGHLTVEGLARALPHAGPVHLYASDACLMQSMEVLETIGSRASYVVGSEQIEDYRALPYGAWLPVLPAPPAHPRCGPRDRACRAAAALVSLQAEALEGTPAADHLTISAVSTAWFRGVTTVGWPAWKASLGEARSDELARVSLKVALEDRRAPAVFVDGSRDAGATLGLVLAWPDAPPALRERTSQLRFDLSRAIIARETAPRYGQDALGLSMALPP